MTLDTSLLARLVAFWRDAGPDRWFDATPDFDRAIKEQFEQAHIAASMGEVAQFLQKPEDALALLLLTDQVPRNLFRQSAHAYATDPLARGIARHALRQRFDCMVESGLRPFFYLPFEHHESTASQTRSTVLFRRHAEQSGDPDGLHHAERHAELISRFGRFPHRNKALGRDSTEAELAYLAHGGFSG